MAAFRAARPIEDFFVNPAAFTLGAPPQPTNNMVNDNGLYSAATEHYNDCWFANTKDMAFNGKAPATNLNLVNDSMHLRGYSSEEEAASPIDDDTCSLHSHDSAISDFTFPETLAESCNHVEQQCSRAQAITIQPAGRAKVVSLPKLVDIPSRRGVVRPASIQHRRKSSSGNNSTKQVSSARTSQDSHQGSVHSSVMNSPASTAPSSLIIEQSVETTRRSSVSRYVPLLEAVRAISPTTPTAPSMPSTPVEPRSATHLKRENTISSQRSNSATPSLRPTLKRMNKLSSNLRLTRIGKEFRDTFTPRDAARGSLVEEPEAVTVTQQTPHQPPRDSSKPKMVARGADERAPTIELPPFPDDRNDFGSDWPLRIGAIYPEMMSVSNRVASAA